MRVTNIVENLSKSSPIINFVVHTVPVEFCVIAFAADDASLTDAAAVFDNLATAASIPALNGPERVEVEIDIPVVFMFLHNNPYLYYKPNTAWIT